jgi:peptidyl-prolyl cis-trans isomerase D
VRDQIKARVERTEAAKLAKEAAAKKLAELSAAPNDAGFGKPRTVSRSKPEGLPDGAMKAVMRAPTDKLPVFVSAELDGDATGVFQVVSARMPAQTDAARKDQLAKSIQGALGGGDDFAYVNALKTKYKAEVLNPELKGVQTAPAFDDKDSGKDGK